MLCGSMRSPLRHPRRRASLCRDPQTHYVLGQIDRNDKADSVVASGAVLQNRCIDPEAVKCIERAVKV